MEVMAMVMGNMEIDMEKVMDKRLGNFYLNRY
jgi:hypothetical protein